jgi:hypothetical protein
MTDYAVLYDHYLDIHSVIFKPFSGIWEVCVTDAGTRETAERIVEAFNHE